jgi:hypothetical protein
MSLDELNSRWLALKQGQMTNESLLAQKWWLVYEYNQANPQAPITVQNLGD